MALGGRITLKHIALVVSVVLTAIAVFHWYFLRSRAYAEAAAQYQAAHGPVEVGLCAFCPKRFSAGGGSSTYRFTLVVAEGDGTRHVRTTVRSNAAGYQVSFGE